MSSERQGVYTSSRHVVLHVCFCGYIVQSNNVDNFLVCIGFAASATWKIYFLTQYRRIDGIRKDIIRGNAAIAFDIFVSVRRPSTTTTTIPITILILECITFDQFFN